jgi:hypothetical protein
LTGRLFAGVVSETNSENYPLRSQKEISQKTLFYQSSSSHSSSFFIYKLIQRH